MAGIYPDRLTADEARRVLDDARADVLIVGHTHIPFRVDVQGRGVIVNPGALLRDPAEPLVEGLLIDPDGTASASQLSASPGLFAVLDLPSLAFRVFTARGDEREPLRRVIQ